MIVPVWELLILAPRSAGSTLQHFLDYCLALTVENPKFLPVVYAWQTGAMVLNRRGQTIWASAIDYCLSAFNDVIHKGSHPGIDYNSLVVFEKSNHPEENSIETDVALNIVQPCNRGLIT